MTTVGIRELKNKLSEYLRLVGQGETIQVTDRGKVVAELRAPGTVADGPTPYPKLNEMIRRGEVYSMGDGINRPELYTRTHIEKRGGDFSAQILDELRGDR